MKILVDMNLSPLWVQALDDHGFTAIHWSSVGDGRAPDVSPGHLSELVARALRQHKEMIQQGALISIDEARLRSRILPLLE